MPTFMDVHRQMHGLTAAALTEVHRADLAIESDESVHFQQVWADPQSGFLFCLSEGPSREAVMRVHERAGHPTTEVYEVGLSI
jgi:hypothetical protein